MPAQYQNHTEFISSSLGTPIPFDVPEGTQAGDLLIVFVNFRRQTTNTINGPAGWSKLFQRSGSNFLVCGVFWRIADGTEATNYTFSCVHASARRAGVMVRFTGVDQANPINDFAQDDGFSLGVLPAATATVENCVALRMIGTSGAAVITTPPADHTIRWAFAHATTPSDNANAYGFTSDLPYAVGEVSAISGLFHTDREYVSTTLLLQSSGDVVVPENNRKRRRSAVAQQYLSQMRR